MPNEAGRNCLGGGSGEEELEGGRRGVGMGKEKEMREKSGSNRRRDQ